MCVCVCLSIFARLTVSDGGDLVRVQGDVTGRQRAQVSLINVLNLSNKVFWLVVKETIDLSLQLICSRERERERERERD